ncbi:hypothetical protein [Gemmata sp.]|uniref:hypothetical protein n=1 Tax=Gemmata sp. TaxID=1914242 RepID=UPI003F6F1ECC
MAPRGRSSADDTLAAELASGRTIAEAAVAAHVSARTAYRRLQSEAFKRRVTELRDAMISRAAGRLADSLTEAIGVLRTLLGSSSEPVQLRAADRLLDHAIRVAQLEELERRVRELEGRERS